MSSCRFVIAFFVVPIVSFVRVSFFTYLWMRSSGRSLSAGLVFIKMHKVGGSTFAGVMRRIGARHGLAHLSDCGSDPQNTPAPSVWACHGQMRQVSTHLKYAMPSAFRVTLIRNPVERRLSDFYHYASRFDLEPNATNKIRYLQTTCDNTCINDYYTSYAQCADGHPPPPNDLAYSMMRCYDFVAVMERFDESLLLLSQKLGIDQLDILYLSAKQSGKAVTDHLDRHLHRNGKVLLAHPPLTQESEEVQEAATHFDDSYDWMLLDLANKALDSAIAQYGTSFEDDLKEFKRKLKVVEEKCRDRFFESCFWNDNGCGQECIDTLANAEGWA
eukprot:gnl/TRDRNA2_/TRDRNA2_174297_c0_seq1.p1 gnl/TRDRNA2_/TRDRNA2_174297_c0~~gnl/TRDRNA2_/TRDRNA2_174297_c0_seq1.p1  ORF type:complete len:330 (+),score=19.92 gnl/TRDRNA2_/TRDRNA2_174297_c0_seq1:49-1038(+)